MTTASINLNLDVVNILEQLLASASEPALVSSLETTLHIAYGLEGNSNSGNSGGHNRRGRVISWTTPERLFFKCLLGVLIRQGLAKADLVARFKRRVPDYQEFFDIPVTDSALWGRADTGRRSGYRSEHPDVNFQTRPYWGRAQMVVAQDRPLTAAEVRVLVDEAGNATTDEEVVEDETKTTNTESRPTDTD